MDKEIAKCLIEEALAARRRAYAPYSNYLVGAAVLAADHEGRIDTGCNVENASFGATICAERVAILKAVQAGAREISAIAVIGGPREYDTVMPGEATPCGMCRQVLREFALPERCEVIIARSAEEYRVTTLEALLPDSFGPQKLRT